LDPSELADAVALILGFFLPHLLEGAGEATQDAMQVLGEDAWLEAQDLWAILLPALERRPPAQEAARNVARTPGEASMSALRRELGALFEGDRALARDVSALIMGGAFASLGDTSTPTRREGTQVAPGQITLDGLKLERLKYFAGLVGILVVSLLAARIFESLSLFAVALLAPVPLTVHFARKVGLRGAEWLGAATLIPGGAWIALFGILSFRPPHLTTRALAGRRIPERGELEPWARYLTVFGFLPLGLGVLLLVLNPSYMRQLFTPPLGWIFLVIALLGVVLSPVAFWLGFWERRAWSGGRLALVAIGASLILPSLLALLFGPAAVQVFEPFGLGGTYLP